MNRLILALFALLAILSPSTLAAERIDQREYLAAFEESDFSFQYPDFWKPAEGSRGQAVKTLLAFSLGGGGDFFLFSVTQTSNSMLSARNAYDVNRERPETRKNLISTEQILLGGKKAQRLCRYTFQNGKRYVFNQIFAEHNESTYAINLYYLPSSPSLDLILEGYEVVLETWQWR